MAKRLKNVEMVDETGFGVCLWKMPDGEYLADGNGNMLSVQGRMYDPVLEEKMRQSAVNYMGLIANGGGVAWVPGARKISQHEHDDQMERLLDGQIPDPVDALQQLKNKGKA